MADISPALDPLMRSFSRYLRASTRESYLAHEAGRVKAATVASRYRSLQQFFKWLTEEEELAADPMAKMRPPKVPEQPVAILSSDDQRAILATCDKGKSFPDRRDAAILRLFIDTGMRLSEMAGLKVAGRARSAGQASPEGAHDRPRTQVLHGPCPAVVEGYWPRRPLRTIKAVPAQATRVHTEVH